VAPGIIAASSRIVGQQQDFSMKYTARSAALVALALAWPLAHAQSPSKPPAAGATKTFGAGKPGGKLLTRDELRACMALQKQMQTQASDLEAQKAPLQQEKVALQQAGDALAADREALERNRQATAAPFQAKADAHGQRIEAFNKKSAELAALEKQGSLGKSEKLRGQLETEQSELRKNEEALRAEMDALNKTNADAASAMNARVAEHEQKVRAWNQRNDALTASIESHRTSDDRWASQCSDRRYDELDEIAIRQGR
jgi:DNA repair exonuclease SbcCD ATPase subunit